MLTCRSIIYARKVFQIFKPSIPQIAQLYFINLINAQADDELLKVADQLKNDGLITEELCRGGSAYAYERTGQIKEAIQNFQWLRLNKPETSLRDLQALAENLDVLGDPESLIVWKEWDNHDKNDKTSIGYLRALETAINSGDPYKSKEWFELARKNLANNPQAQAHLLFMTALAGTGVDQFNKFRAILADFSEGGPLAESGIIRLLSIDDLQEFAQSTPVEQIVPNLISNLERLQNNIDERYNRGEIPAFRLTYDQNETLFEFLQARCQNHKPRYVAAGDQSLKEIWFQQNRGFLHKPPKRCILRFRVNYH